MANKDKPTDRHLLVLGMGYSARAFIKLAAGDFASMAGTTRSSDNFEALQALGVKPVLFAPAPNANGDVSGDSFDAVLAQTTDLLVSVGPDEAGDVVLSHLAEKLQVAPNLQTIIYYSTVGVYGDHGGAWVDETSTCDPVSKRSMARLVAERQWQEFAESKNTPLSILRLSGIYGPGRNAIINMEKGTARRIVKKGQFFNRIHVDDIAQATRLAFTAHASGIFNISDDEPAPPQDVVSYVHCLAGREPPPALDFDTADLTPMARSFYGECKKARNQKSKEQLGMVYQWPNYRASLKAMWEKQTWIAE